MLSRTPRYLPARSRVLAVSALAVSALVTALAVVPGPTASASLPIDRSVARTRVVKVHVSPSFFGVHDDHGTSLHRKGTGQIRLWDSGTQWGDIFPTEADITAAPGPQWAHLDSVVTQAHKNHTQVLLVLGLTPQYAATDPTSPTYATSMPNLSLYEAYVRAIMTHYSPKNWGYRGIAAYQVWNESNISTFWTGTFPQLAQLVKAVHDVRNQVDPGAQVVGPAMVTRLGYEARGAKRFYATRIGGKPVWSYVDAISLNLYPLDTYLHPKRPGTPEDSMALLAQMRTYLAKDHVPASKPIWDTEVNYGLRSGSNGGKPALKIPTSLQVAYVMRTYLLNAAAGVKHVDWYAYDMSNRGTLGPIGNTLMTNPKSTTGKLLAPGLAFFRIQTWMKGTLIGTAGHRPCSANSAGTYVCVVKYATGGYGRIYWNPTRTVSVHAVSTATRKVTGVGATSRLSGGSSLRVGYLPVLVRSKQ